MLSRQLQLWVEFYLPSKHPFILSFSYNEKGNIQGKCRRGYSVSKRLVKLTRFQDFPSQLPGNQDLPPLSLALNYQL